MKLFNQSISIEIALAMSRNAFVALEFPKKMMASLHAAEKRSIIITISKVRLRLIFSSILVVSLFLLRQQNIKLRTQHLHNNAIKKRKQKKAVIANIRIGKTIIDVTYSTEVEISMSVLFKFLSK